MGHDKLMHRLRNSSFTMPTTTRKTLIFLSTGKGVRVAASSRLIEIPMPPFGVLIATDTHAVVR